jgi:hypothetical protein
MCTEIGGRRIYLEVRKPQSILLDEAGGLAMPQSFLPQALRQIGGMK